MFFFSFSMWLLILNVSIVYILYTVYYTAQLPSLPHRIMKYRFDCSTLLMTAWPACNIFEQQSHFHTFLVLLSDSRNITEHIMHEFGCLKTEFSFQRAGMNFNKLSQSLSLSLCLSLCELFFIAHVWRQSQEQVNCILIVYTLRKFFTFTRELSCFRGTNCSKKNKSGPSFSILRSRWS